MVDFTLSGNDKDILESVAAEAKAGEKYARYYDEHEDEVLPKAFPEAKGFPSILERIRRRPVDDTAPFIMQMLIKLEREAHNGVPLRQAPMALGMAQVFPRIKRAQDGIRRHPAVKSAYQLRERFFA